MGKGNGNKKSRLRDFSSSKNDEYRKLIKKSKVVSPIKIRLTEVNADPSSIVRSDIIKDSAIWNDTNKDSRYPISDSSTTLMINWQDVISLDNETIKADKNWASINELLVNGENILIQVTAEMTEISTEIRPNDQLKNTLVIQNPLKRIDNNCSNTSNVDVN